LLNNRIDEDDCLTIELMKMIVSVKKKGKGGEAGEVGDSMNT